MTHFAATVSGMRRCGLYKFLFTENANLSGVYAFADYMRMRCMHKNMVYTCNKYFWFVVRSAGMVNWTVPLNTESTTKLQCSVSASCLTGKLIRWTASKEQQ